jgi:glucan 1,3-beta-glucosidase
MHSSYDQGTWVWTADHDLDTTGSPQTSIFTGRGILSESTGPVWFIGTCKSIVSVFFLILTMVLATACESLSQLIL